MKRIIYFVMIACVATMVGCKNDDNGSEDMSAKEQALKRIVADYTAKNVIPIYDSLANATIDLYDACAAMLEKFDGKNLTEADVKVAAGHWENARKYWERSESFLYGPVAIYNIDPHIDSWPLDQTAMEALLGNAETMKLVEEQGADYVSTKLGYGLLGFHAAEYMLYAHDNADKSNVKLYPIADYTRAKLVYLKAVAEDLRNQTVLLQACWEGIDKVSAAKKKILQDAELDDKSYETVGYAWYMNNAGASGSSFKTFQESAEEIIQGCIDIADEVGNTKIGTPCNAANDEDRNYIESPYSLNSIEDFQDNIRSIRNSYAGVNGGSGLSNYVQSINPDLDTKVKKAIEDALKAIAAIPEPFASNATGAESKNAVKVVGTDLANVLSEVMELITK